MNTNVSPLMVEEKLFQDVMQFGRVLNSRLNIGLQRIGQYSFIAEYYSMRGELFTLMIHFQNYKTIVYIYNSRRVQVLHKVLNAGELSNNTYILNYINRTIRS